MASRMTQAIETQLGFMINDINRAKPNVVMVVPVVGAYRILYGGRRYTYGTKYGHMAWIDIEDKSKRGMFNVPVKMMLVLTTACYNFAHHTACLMSRWLWAVLLVQGSGCNDQLYRPHQTVKQANHCVMQLPRLYRSRHLRPPHRVSQRGRDGLT